MFFPHTDVRVASDGDRPGFPAASPRARGPRPARLSSRRVGREANRANHRSSWTSSRRARSRSRSRASFRLARSPACPPASQLVERARDTARGSRETTDRTDATLAGCANVRAALFLPGLLRQFRASLT